MAKAAIGREDCLFVAYRSSVRGIEGAIRGSNPQGYPVGEEGKGAGSSSGSPGGKRAQRADKPQARKLGHDMGEDITLTIQLMPFRFGFVRNRAGRSLAPRRPAKIVFRPSFRALRRLQPENTNAFTVAGGEYGSHKSFRVPSGIGLPWQPVSPEPPGCGGLKDSPARARFSASAGSGLHDVALY